MRATDTVAEARRVMEICNACRYCEGYCAVFPAMERRREFSNADLSYLANLCHDCRGCYYACQYAPPHEFNVNLPRTFAQLRAETYEEYAWPKPLARLFRRNGVIGSLVVAAALGMVLWLTMRLQMPDVLYRAHTGVGAFYAVIPYGVMVAVGLVTFGYAILALSIGYARFQRDTMVAGSASGGGAWRRALGDAAVLRYLSGGGHGCNDRDDAFSNTRRWLHQAMAYGFVFCFAATCVATVYHHILGWVAPYPLISVPVVLGMLGGAGLLIGTVGLLFLKGLRDSAPSIRALLGADAALLVLLALVAATGLLLLTLRNGPAMGFLLAIHLGFVLALFLVLPYGKFVHAVYRLGALVHYAAETSAAAASNNQSGEL